MFKPPTKASPAPLVSTISSGGTWQAGYSVTTPSKAVDFDLINGNHSTTMKTLNERKTTLEHAKFHLEPTPQDLNHV